MSGAIEIPLPIARFLRDAAGLTLDQWTAVYWRFVRDPSIMKAIRKFGTIALQSWLDQRKTLSVDQATANDRVSAQVMAAMQAVLASLPEKELDERGGRLRQRAQFIIANVNDALEHADLLNADPACRKAVKRLLAVFDEMIVFPEYQ